jgi:hypothetical protein
MKIPGDVSVMTANHQRATRKSLACTSAGGAARTSAMLDEMSALGIAADSSRRRARWTRRQFMTHWRSQPTVFRRPTRCGSNARSRSRLRAGRHAELKLDDDLRHAGYALCHHPGRVETEPRPGNLAQGRRPGKSHCKPAEEGSALPRRKQHAFECNGPWIAPCGRSGGSNSYRFSLPATPEDQFVANVQTLLPFDSAVSWIPN